jgi:hypothetical protein
MVGLYGSKCNNFEHHFSMNTIENFMEDIENNEKKPSDAVNFFNEKFKMGFDLSVTSPPYAFTEFYSSYTPDYGKENMFKKMFERLTCFYLSKMRSGGYFILNLSLGSDVRNKINLTMNSIEDILTKGNGFRSLSLVQRLTVPTSGNVYSIRKGKEAEVEAILIFKMEDRIIRFQFSDKEKESKEKGKLTMIIRQPVSPTQKKLEN